MFCRKLSLPVRGGRMNNNDPAPDLGSLNAEDAAKMLAEAGGGEIVAALTHLRPAIAQDILDALPLEARKRALAAAPDELSRQWQRNALYERETVGRLREPVIRAYPPAHTVAPTVESLAIEISVRAGTMAGVEKEERITTPWWRSVKLRHRWLQLNRITAFLAAAVVGYFQDTIDRLVILALFLPVLAGQSGNTGCQALAVTLRGMTLGELKPGKGRPLVSKETWVGCLNGAGVGLMAAIGMYITAVGQHQTEPFMLALVGFLAMVFSCIASGLSGALVPITLKRFGFDPATASSIFLTTATDVVSMGTLLFLATILVR